LPKFTRGASGNQPIGPRSLWTEGPSPPAASRLQVWQQEVLLQLLHPHHHQPQTHCHPQAHWKKQETFKNQSTKSEPTLQNSLYKKNEYKITTKIVRTVLPAFYFKQNTTFLENAIKRVSSFICKEAFCNSSP